MHLCLMYFCASVCVCVYMCEYGLVSSNNITMTRFEYRQIQLSETNRHYRFRITLLLLFHNFRSLFQIIF